MNALARRTPTDSAEMEQWKRSVNDDIAMLIRTVTDNGEAMIELVRLVSALAANVNHDQQTIDRIEERFRVGLLEIDRRIDDFQLKMKELG